MATRIENIKAVRDWLGNPRPNSPSFNSLLRQELAEEQRIANSLNNTGKAWSTQTYTLNYPAGGQNTFTINAANFGKVLFVTRLLPQNPYISAIPVPFTDINELQYGTILAPFYSIYSNWMTVPANTIEKMAFYREGVINPQFKVKIEPLPRESCQYEITYLVGAVGRDDPLESTLAVPEYAVLIQLRNALAQLPYAEWSDDVNYNLMRKKELRESFLFQLYGEDGRGGHTAEYNEYKKSLVHPKIVEVDWMY